MDHKFARIIIITGLSGAGKTTALNALRNQGFFCVDNQPALLLPDLLALDNLTGEARPRLAMVLDLREKNALDGFRAAITRLQAEQYDFNLVFLTAASDILLRTFSYSRRSHPLADGGDLFKAIEKEREILRPVREAAHEVLDTSYLTPEQLKEIVVKKYSGEAKGINLELVSFGYKNGLPLEADIVMDARFLRNPYYQEDLRPLNGTDPRVIEYVMSDGEGRRFIKRFFDFLDHLIPLYHNGGKSYLTIAVGCTGGQHRSVAVVGELARYFAATPYNITVRHRDI